MEKFTNSCHWFTIGPIGDDIWVKILHKPAKMKNEQKVQKIAQNQKCKLHSLHNLSQQ